MVELCAETISEQIDDHGFAMVRGHLSEEAMRGMVGLLESRSHAAVAAASAVVGADGAPLTVDCIAKAGLATLARELYSALAPIANRWMEQMGFEAWYAAEFDDYLRLNVRANHDPFRARLSRLRAGQGGLVKTEINGALTFPLQAVALLGEQHEHFEGGDLVLLEQGAHGLSTQKIVPIPPSHLAIVPVWTRAQLQPDGRVNRLMVSRVIRHVTAGVRDGMELLFHVPC